VSGRAHRARAAVTLRRAEGLLPYPSEITADALFPIYSVTKTLTAACVFRLAEEHLMSLDAPIGLYVSDVPLPKGVTVSRLLRHTSGLGEYGPLERYHAAVRASPSVPWTRSEFLEAVLPTGFLFRPGQGWAYSNIGYMLLVDAIENVTGTTFAQVIHRLICQPLDLSKTVTLETLEDLTRCNPGFGTEVTPDASLVDVRGIYHPGWCAPRLIASTGSELTAVFHALFGGRLLSSRSLETMLDMALLPVPEGEEPTIAGEAGVYSDTASPYGRNYSHGGGGPGYELSVTTFARLPDDTLTVAVFVDSSLQPGAAREIESNVMKAVFSL